MDNAEKKDGLLCFCAAFLLSFSLFFYGPLEIFLCNLEEMDFMGKYVLMCCIPLSLAVMAAVMIAAKLIKGKAHDIFLRIVFGFSIAVYIQGNFLQISAGTIDGTSFSADLSKKLINLIEWAAVISLPFIADRYFKEYYKKILYFVTVMITVMQLAALASYRSVAIDDGKKFLVINMKQLTSEDMGYMLSYEYEYRYSSDHNIIIFVADEYDSFYFDGSLEDVPEFREAFKDFTYYRDTLGASAGTVRSMSYVFKGNFDNEDYSDSEFFPALKENGYNIGFYTDNEVFPANIPEYYAENYIKHKFTASEILFFGKGMYCLVFYKYFPIITKPLFYMTHSDVLDFTSASEAYKLDNLVFYNSLDNPITITENKCFKLIHIDGLHPFCSVDKNLNRVKKAVPFDEESIAVNKIISAYLDKLKEAGVYDNSDIIIMGDHGRKDNDRGKYPMLMIKRSGESGDTLNVSDMLVSYKNMYPTLLYLAGKTPEEKTVFELTENDNYERCFPETEEYYYGPIKPKT